MIKYTIQIRTDYRPWWAPWRKRVPFEYRTWRNDRRVNDIFNIELFRSICEPPSIKLNGIQVKCADVWVDGVLYMQVPDATASLTNSEFHIAGDGKEITTYDYAAEPDIANHIYWPKEFEDRG
jgi:hypothetical protein